MRSTLRISLFLAFAVLLFASCQKNLPHIKPLAITSLSPASGSYNTTVVVKGTGFSTILSSNIVFFNGKAAVISAVTDTTITVTVPIAAGTGPVTVTVNGSPAVTGPVFTYQQTPVVSTIAGGSTAGNADGLTTTATFQNLWGIVVDSKGNLFVSQNQVNGIIREISNGSVTTFAGDVTSTNGGIYYGVGTVAKFEFPKGMAIDPADNVFVTDIRLSKISPAALVSPGNFGSSTNAFAITVDASDNIYSGDRANTIDKTTPALTTTIIAGTGIAGSADGTGTAASFNDTYGMTIDNAGNIYIVDQGSNLIRKMTPAGVVTTIAGTGSTGSADGVGRAASFNRPTGIAVDAAGNLYIADTGNNKIRKIAPNGTVTTLAGTGTNSSTDGVAATATFSAPVNVAVDATGSIYVTENTRIRKISLQ